MAYFAEQESQSLLVTIKLTFYSLLSFIINIMKRKTILLPKTRKILETLGANIKLARLRRKLSAVQVSE